MAEFNVGPGVAERMAALGDEAIANSTWLKIDDDLVIEKGQGSKGKYLAHNITPDASWMFVERIQQGEFQIVDRRHDLPKTASYSGRSLSGIKGITVHYTATDPSASIEAIAAGQLTRWADAQQTVRFPAIAYTIVVDAAGVVSLCHSLEIRPWHSGAVINGEHRNTTHMGICWIGNHTPNPAQLIGLKGAIDWVEGQLGRTLPVEGHRDAPYATACPGPTWPAWKAQIL